MTGRYKAYAEYKDSGVNWLGRIPQHWQASKLASCAKITRLAGYEYTSHWAPIENGEIIALRGQNIKFNKLVDLDNVERISDSLSLKLNRSRLYKNDIVYPCVGSIGNATLISEDDKYHINQNIAKLTPSEFIYPLYLSYFLNSSVCLESALFLNTSDAQPSILVGNLRRVKMAHPKYEEQQKIANFLDHETAKIDTLIAKQEKLIELLKEKRQAVISHAVTKGLNPNAPMKDSGVEWLGEVPEHWDVIFIKHLSQVKRGASPRPIDDPKYFDDNGEYAWTRIADVSSSGMYLTETTQRLSTLGSSLSVRLEAGELFLSIAGTVGKPCITTSKACIHDGFVYFPQLRINNKYLYYIFDAGQAYLGLGKMGTQLNLNTDTVGGIKIGLPPANEIEEIIFYIEQKNTQYTDLISKAVSSIDLMKERKTALISAAVTGKIDVRDWEKNN